VAHEDIDALRDAAHEEIRALLTEEQLAMLDELAPPMRAGMPFPMPRPHMGFGNHGGFAQDRFAEELQSTEEQEAAIDAIRTELEEAVRARHEQARDEFLALLTDEQLEQIDWVMDEEGEE